MYKHTSDRLLTRYGLHIDRHVKNLITDAISKGEGECIMKQSNNKTVWRIPLTASMLSLNIKLGAPPCPHDSIIVVYDKKRRGLSTALPPESTIENIKEWYPE
jgi:hypothetical protein